MDELKSRMVRAMAESQAEDDEGRFDRLMDILGFSGENKTRTVLRAALNAALEAAEGEGFRLTQTRPSPTQAPGPTDDETPAHPGPAPSVIRVETRAVGTIPESLPALTL